MHEVEAVVGYSRVPEQDLGDVHRIDLFVHSQTRSVHDRPSVANYPLKFVAVFLFVLLNLKCEADGGNFRVPTVAFLLDILE